MTKKEAGRVIHGKINTRVKKDNYYLLLNEVSYDELSCNYTDIDDDKDEKFHELKRADIENKWSSEPMK